MSKCKKGFVILTVATVDVPLVIASYGNSLQIKGWEVCLDEFYT